VVIAVNHKILCFGDSNTYGYDPRSYLGGRYPASVRWTALLQAAGWVVMNAGENGRCIPQTDIEARMLGQTACRAEVEAIAIMLGSNDLLQQFCPSAKVCAERMERFLTTLLEEGPVSYKVLLIAPPSMKVGAWINDPETLEESRRLADCYEALAQKLVIHFADAGNWNVGLAFDGVHFSEAGHRSFAVGMRNTLENFFSLRIDCRNGFSSFPAK